MSRECSAGVPLKHANRRVPIRDVRPLSPAERSERYRQGLRCTTQSASIVVSDRIVTGLVRRGYLGASEIDDTRAVREALSLFFWDEIDRSTRISALVVLARQCAYGAGSQRVREFDRTCRGAAPFHRGTFAHVKSKCSFITPDPWSILNCHPLALLVPRSHSV
jgi:hypothetical protein